MDGRWSWRSSEVAGVCSGGDRRGGKQTSGGLCPPLVGLLVGQRAIGVWPCRCGLAGWRWRYSSQLLSPASRLAPRAARLGSSHRLVVGSGATGVAAGVAGWDAGTVTGGSVTGGAGWPPWSIGGVGAGGGGGGGALGGG